MLFGAAIGLLDTQRVDGSGAASSSSPSCVGVAGRPWRRSTRSSSSRSARTRSSPGSRSRSSRAGWDCPPTSVPSSGSPISRRAPVRRPRRPRARGPARARPDPLRPVRARVRVLGRDAPRRRCTSVARAWASMSAPSARRRLGRRHGHQRHALSIRPCPRRRCVRGCRPAPATASRSRAAGPRGHTRERRRLDRDRARDLRLLEGRALPRGRVPLRGAVALPFALQARDVDVAPEFLYALPYVMTIVVLVLVSTGLSKRRLGAPAALGVPYVREER